MQEGKNEKTVPQHTFSDSVEHAIAHIKEAVLLDMPEEQKRWYAVKIFERDEKVIEKLNISESVLKQIESDIASAEKEYDATSMIGSQVRNLRSSIGMLREGRVFINAKDPYVEGNNYTFISHAKSLGGANFRMLPLKGNEEAAGSFLAKMTRNHSDYTANEQAIEEKANEISRLTYELEDAPDDRKEDLQKQLDNANDESEALKERSNLLTANQIGDWALEADLNLFSDPAADKFSSQELDAAFQELNFGPIWSAADDCSKVYRDFEDKLKDGPLSAEDDAAFRTRMKEKTSLMKGALAKSLHAADMNRDKYTRILFGGNPGTLEDALFGPRGLQTCIDTINNEQAFLNSGMPLSERNTYTGLLSHTTFLKNRVGDMSRFLTEDAHRHLEDTVEAYTRAVKELPDKNDPKAISSYYLKVHETLEHLNAEVARMRLDCPIDDNKLTREIQDRSRNNHEDPSSVRESVMKDIYKLVDDSRAELFSGRGKDMRNLLEDKIISLGQVDEKQFKRDRRTFQASVSSISLISKAKDEIREIYHTLLDTESRLGRDGRTKEYYAFKRSCEEFLQLNGRSTGIQVHDAHLTLVKNASAYAISEGFVKLRRSDARKLFGASLRAVSVIEQMAPTINADKTMRLQEPLDRGFPVLEPPSDDPGPVQHQGQGRRLS